MNAIKKYRLLANLTQKQLASLVEVTQACVSKWEHERSFPLIKTARRLSDVLNIPLSQIYDQKPPTSQFSIPVYESVSRDGTGCLLSKNTPSIVLTKEELLTMTPSAEKKPAPSGPSKKADGKHTCDPGDISISFFGFCRHSAFPSPFPVQNLIHIIYRTETVFSNGIYLVSINWEDCVLAQISKFNQSLVVLSEDADNEPRLFQASEIRRGAVRVHGLLVEKREMYRY